VTSVAFVLSRPHLNRGNVIFCGENTHGSAIIHYLQVFHAHVNPGFI
jgi:hypothetical protein